MAAKPAMTGAPETARVVAAFVLLAAALQLPPLDVQSFLGDEATTVVVLDQGVGAMLGDLSWHESNPLL